MLVLVKRAFCKLKRYLQEQVQRCSENIACSLKAWKTGRKLEGVEVPAAAHAVPQAMHVYMCVYS
jgi:hypothetical protein